MPVIVIELSVGVGTLLPIAALRLLLSGDPMQPAATASRPSTATIPNRFICSLFPVDCPPLIRSLAAPKRSAAGAIEFSAGSH